MENMMKCCICGEVDDSHTAYCSKHGRVLHEMNENKPTGEWEEINQGEYKKIKRDDPKDAYSYTARIGFKFFKRKEETLSDKRALNPKGMGYHEEDLKESIDDLKKINCSVCKEKADKIFGRILTQNGF